MRSESLLHRIGVAAEVIHKAHIHDMSEIWKFDFVDSFLGASFGGIVSQDITQKRAVMVLTSKVTPLVQDGRKPAYFMNVPCNMDCPNMNQIVGGDLNAALQQLLVGEDVHRSIAADRAGPALAPPAPRGVPPQVRIFSIRRSDIAQHEYTAGCKGFSALRLRKPLQGHSDECRSRIIEHLSQQPASTRCVEQVGERRDAKLARYIERHDQAQEGAQHATQEVPAGPLSGAPMHPGA